MAFGLAAVYLLLLNTGAQGFGILPGKSLSHQEISEIAILNVTVQTCRSVAQTDGTTFNIPLQPFTAEGVVISCGAPQSSKSFSQAIRSIILRNVRVDLRHALNASYHFDDEMFISGRKIITEGLRAVKASNKQGNFEAAREKLGEICHPLQDYYSHSNHVEIGRRFPNSNLISSNTSIGNIAAESTPTCRNCDGDNCTNNILEEIIQGKMLTSGYFGIVPLASHKPKGKCSHGGGVDQTSTIEPKGGINKDTFDASHGHLHKAAADMATAATSELLEDIRSAAGDRQFLQMLGISKGSSKALCFVIDTTKSMSEDIAAVRNVTNFIIDSQVGTENEPALYILVPFSDPESGPLLKTTDPTIFKTLINSIVASGGGDEEELSLSGLQLALAGAPSHSEIFLFTDAPAKDKDLENTVIALIERTQTVVNFMITGSTTTNRRRRGHANQNQHRISDADSQLYRDLAQAAGGQTIEISKSELVTAASIIIESSASSLVTILQAARSPGKADTFFFLIDDTIKNLRVYITGNNITFTVTSPTGVSQKSSDASGSLITASQTVGNFLTIHLIKETGTWEMKMDSNHPYTLKVMGQSLIDFIFDFVAASQGTFEGFDALDTRPRAGVNGTLLVSITGSDTATVTEVALVKSLGSEEIKGTLEKQERGSYLVHFDRMPSGAFVVKLKGQNNDSSSKATSSAFQRQTPTNFRSSNLTITANANSIMEPGTPFLVPFSLTTNGAGGNFSIRATNNRLFKSTFPSSLSLEAGGSANGTLTLSAPLNTPSGTDVILTIEAEAPGGEDANYVVQRFSIVNTVTDFTAPKCEQLDLQSNCSGSCSSSKWNFSVRVSDGADGTGVDRVSLQKGNGTLNTTVDSNNEKAILVTYVASCCSAEAELLVVDRIGNVGTCSFNPTEGLQEAQSAATRVTQSPLLFVSTVVFVLHILTEQVKWHQNS